MAGRGPRGDEHTRASRGASEHDFDPYAGLDNEYSELPYDPETFDRWLTETMTDIWDGTYRRLRDRPYTSSAQELWDRSRILEKVYMLGDRKRQSRMGERIRETLERACDKTQLIPVACRHEGECVRCFGVRCWRRNDVSAIDVSVFLYNYTVVVRLQLDQHDSPPAAPGGYAEMPTHKLVSYPHEREAAERRIKRAREEHMVFGHRSRKHNKYVMGPTHDDLCGRCGLPRRGNGGLFITRE